MDREERSNNQVPETLLDRMSLRSSSKVAGAIKVSFIQLGAAALHGWVCRQ